MQKLINPFIFKEQNPYPGIVYRNDNVVTSHVSFKFIYDRFFSLIVSKIDGSFPTLSYSDNRTIGAIWGLSVRDDMFTKSVDLSKKIAKSIFYVINILTSSSKPHSLLDKINCDVKTIPTIVLNIVRMVNSHQYLVNIEGTFASYFKWSRVETSYIFPDGEKFKNFDDANRVKIEIEKLNETFKILKVSFLGVSDINDLSDLFIPSGYELNTSTRVEGGSEFLEIGDCVTEDELIYGILSGCTYNIGEKRIVQSIPIKLDNKTIIQMLKINSSLFNDPNINMAGSVRLMNEYLSSNIGSQANKEQEYKGFKTRKGSIGPNTLPSKQKRINKVTGLNVKKEVDSAGIDNEIT